ncbi:hypothetical protein [Methylobacterium sp. E-046]|uniref:hypothetical protein n=1 Tax=Methylobacterium sp. E-046 TaxID=2836576 RepID=UPI001FB88881|nr:hypothetical protein [Methylobacterium sp. E-046]MCJ2097493.1 hypothetical protein [Methylobacterium sp. E-046]
MDYSEIYRDVTHFGVWAHDGADGNGKRDALAILAAAIEQTEDRDFRHDRDVLEALDYLTDLAGRLPAATAYKAALAIQHPPERRQALSAAYERLARHLGDERPHGR